MFPACLAVSVQVPTVNRLTNTVSTLLKLVQTSGELLVTATARPDVAVAGAGMTLRDNEVAPMAGNAIVCDAGVTVNFTVTGEAAPYVVLPDCVAVSEHVPPSTIVTVKFRTVQTGIEFDVKVTRSPELALAVGEKGPDPKTTLAIGENVIV